MRLHNVSLPITSLLLNDVIRDRPLRIPTTGPTTITGLVHAILKPKISCSFLALFASIVHAFGVFSAYFVDTVSNMVLTFGIFTGLGAGVVFIAMGAFIKDYFDDRMRNLVQSANVIAFCMAGCVFPKVLLVTRIAYGYDGYILVMGALLSVVPVLCCLLEFCRRKNVLQQQPPSTMCTITMSHEALAMPASKPPRPQYGSIFRAPMFYLITVSYAVFIYTFTFFMSSLIDVAFDKGITPTYAITIVPQYSVAEIVGRVVVPAILPTKQHRRVIFMVDYLVIGTVLLLVPLTYSYVTLLFACLSMGVFNASVIALQGVLVADYVHKDLQHFANILINILTGCSFLTKPFVAGFFRDVLGSYGPMQQTLGSLVLLSGVAWAIVNCARVASWRAIWTKDMHEPHIHEPIDVGLVSYQLLYGY
ncbi:monocarboxylate transporter 4-like isoform X2 [Ornithodoros turicata]|uniref:monocarboxylate transporter 4-like isoform X2 n=1 Tax=Ornithodoros turicata TaxID=34597 RepID=UPI003139ECD8